MRIDKLTKVLGDWLPHEAAFAAFAGFTAIRLVLVSGPSLVWSLFFSALFWGVWSLRCWAAESASVARQKVRLLAYLPVMLLSYAACGRAVPLVHPKATFFMARADQWIFGRDVALFLEPWMQSWLTDLCYGLYLFFFIYLGVSLWHYGSGNIKILRQFTAGLFTAYGIGFLGYSLLPAGGPYLELSDHFSAPLPGGKITDYASALVFWGTNRVDCFPCLHFAVSFYILVFDYWHCRRRFYWMTLPCVGIWFSTIYLRQHYFVDLLGGLGLVFFALWLAKPGGKIENNDVRQIKIN